MPPTTPMPRAISTDASTLPSIEPTRTLPILKPSINASDTTMHSTPEMADSKVRVTRVFSLTRICRTRGMTIAAAVPATIELSIIDACSSNPTTKKASRVVDSIDTMNENNVTCTTPVQY